MLQHGYVACPCNNEVFLIFYSLIVFVVSSIFVMLKKSFIINFSLHTNFLVLQILNWNVMFPPCL